MIFFSEDIEFLRELYINRSLNIYFFHEKYKLSPLQLSRTINKFKKIDLIVLENRVVYLNEKGRDWVFSKRKELFLEERLKYWKIIPQEMKQNSIEINELYNPNRKKLDKEFFKIYENGN
tara:strand:- start:173 stop:532 length:360 start_codon:yes stop_codon:yes gene_type:complete